jgi:recombinational DNA repair protein RecT
MYTELVGHEALKGSPDSLASAAVVEQKAVMLGLKVRRFMASVTTVTVGASVVVLKKYSAYGVSAGAVTLATLNIPGGTAVGTIIYKDLDSVDVLPGQSLVYEVTSAATSGAAVIGINAYHAEEHPSNVAAMVASA